MTTAVEWYVEQEIELTLDFISKKINNVEYGIKKLRLIEQAKEMEENLAEQFAEFSILCDRSEMNPIKFKDWLEQYDKKTI
jgi:hypothetical protein